MNAPGASQRCRLVKSLVSLRRLGNLCSISVSLHHACVNNSGFPFCRTSEITFPAKNREEKRDYENY